MLLIRAEGTHITRRIVDQTMSNHFVLTLKPLPADASGATGDRTVVGALLRVHIGMRADCSVSKVSNNITRALLTLADTESERVGRCNRGRSI